VKELGEIDMVSLSTLGPVAEDDARPAFPAVHLKGLAALSCAWGTPIGSPARSSRSRADQ
jgi:hypothetical protein